MPVLCIGSVAVALVGAGRVVLIVVLVVMVASGELGVAHLWPVFPGHHLVAFHRQYFVLLRPAKMLAYGNAIIGNKCYLHRIPLV